MDRVESKFASLATDNAPGQEVRQRAGSDTSFRGAPLPGRPVDFSHGDVDAFAPPPAALDAFLDGVREGGRQAYTEYRGSGDIRSALAGQLAAFTGAPVSADEGLILTPGSQGALFLAMAATVAAGDKVAVVQPDYFANRKLVRFLEGEVVPVRLGFLDATRGAGLDLDDLERAFREGARVFVFSNPNNPTGTVYSPDEIRAIGELAERYGAVVIVDQLYSRLLYTGSAYTHLRAGSVDPERIVTIMGPSKTESLSGYRLGVAFGSSKLVERMEKLQAIMCLRAAGYNQAVLRTWLAEPDGWMDERIALHQAIRDDLLAKFRTSPGLAARRPEAGSYLFLKLPELSMGTTDFVRELRHRASVIVTPGSEFGPDSHDFVRLNFSQDHAAAVAAADRMVSLLAEHSR